MKNIISLPKIWSPGFRTIGWLIFASLGLHLFVFVISSTVLQGWFYKHEPMHTLLEVFGSAIALLVAFKLLSFRVYGVGPKHGVRIAQSLIVIGVLDGFHAASHIGNNFVWLHSLATFLGGLLFASIVVPSHDSNSTNQSILILVFSFLVGFSSFIYPSISLPMFTGDSFSLQADLLNFVGGILFIISAARLVYEYYISRSVDDLLFSMHCLLFGLAALMFHSSIIWDASWWGWHILRLLAYVAALVFVIMSEFSLLKEFGKYGYEMNELALTDPLTNAHNRRFFDDKLESEYSRAKRYKNDLSVVILDIDHFKNVNDEYGHDDGDKVLIAMTKCIHQYLRGNDIFARIGGEEFSIILPYTSKDKAKVFVDRIRKALEFLEVKSDDNRDIHITASFGIADFSSGPNSEKDLLKNADHALYSAKRNGRNKTVVYESAH